MIAWIYLILGFILFIGLVVFHEWGHFIFARRNGVEVEEFGLGFPPRAKKLAVRKGTLFSLNWLPLGGFVRLKGEHDMDVAPGSFGAATTAAKVKIMIAGVGMNLLAALVIFTVVALIGMPKLLDSQFTVKSDTKTISQVHDKDVVLVDQVLKGGAAAAAGLKTNDRILSQGNTVSRYAAQPGRRRLSPSA
jgi:regulator of sigma E protease